METAVAEPWAPPAGYQVAPQPQAWQPPAGYAVTAPVAAPAAPTAAPTASPAPSPKYDSVALDKALQQQKQQWESALPGIAPAQQQLVDPWQTHWELAHRYDLHSPQPHPNTAARPGHDELPLDDDEKVTLYQQYRKANQARDSSQGSQQAATQIDPQVLRDQQQHMNAAESLFGEVQAGAAKSPLTRGLTEIGNTMRGATPQEAKQAGAIQQQMSGAAREVHPIASTVGQQAGFMLRPEVAMGTAATGGIAAGVGAGANLATRVAVNAGAAGTSMGSVQTADQLMAGETPTPVKNFAINAAAGGVGTAGAALVGKAITPAFAAANPGKAAAIKFLGGLGVAGGTQAAAGAATGQTSAQDIVANVLAGMASHGAGSGVEFIQELQQARQELAKAPSSLEVDAAIARISREEAALGVRDDIAGAKAVEAYTPPEGYKITSTPERAKAEETSPPAPALQENTHASTVRSDEGQVRAEPAPESRQDKGGENLQQHAQEEVGTTPTVEQARQPESVQAPAVAAEAVKPDLARDVGTSKAVASEGAGKTTAEPAKAQAEPNKPVQAVGAAHPESPEFEDPVAVGIKNAETDRIREEQGLPPRIKDAPLTNDKAWDEGIQRHIADPLASEKLSKELLSSPRAVTPQEGAMLTQRMIWLKNQKRAVMEEINSGRSDSAIAFRLNDLNQAIADHIIMAEKVGRASGQSLQSRKMMGNEGFALTKGDMEDTARAAKKAATGEDLTKDELAAVKEQADKIDETTKAVEKKTEELEDQKRTKRLDEAQEAAKIKVAREELQDSQKDQSDVDPRTRSIVNRITQYLDKISDAAEARIRARGPMVMAGVDPANLADYTIVGSAQIAKGFLKFGEWSGVMVKKFGEGIKPHLQTIYDTSNKHVDSVVEKFAGGNFEKQVKSLIKNKPGTRDLAAEKKSTVQGLKDAVADGAKGYDLARWLKALQEKFIAEGITEREKTLDAVHDVVKGIIPDMTRRETADALSGYGDYKPLNKDEVKTTARQQRGELQALSKLQDVLEKNQAPLKSGVERQEPTDEARRTIKQVNDEMRKRGIQVQSPEMQLKSTLDAIHTRLQHEISDLQYALATGKQFAEGKAKIEYDAKANDLKAQRDELKAQYDKLFNPPEKTNAEKQVTALTKKLTELQQKVAAGDLSTRGPTQGPDVKEVANLKGQIRNVQKQLSDARAADFDRQVKGATAALERAIEQNQKKLDAAERGDFSKREPKTPVKTEELQALRDHNQALKDQVKHLKDTNEAYQNSLKTDRLKAQSEDLLDRLRKNDIALNPNRETPDTPEQAQLRAANQLLRQNLEDLREAAGLYDQSRVDAATKAVTKSIERYQKMLRGEEVPGKTESKTPKTADLEALRKLRDDLQEKAGEQKRQEDLQRQITELDAKIRNDDFGKTQGPPEAKTSLEQERDRLRKLFQQGQRKAEGLRKSPAELALQAAKVRAANSIADTATKLMRGEFQAPPKRITVFSDPELSQLQAEQARWRQRFQNSLRQWQEKQKPLWAKIIHVAGQIPRASVLAGYTTLIKLPMASFWNLAAKIPTEIAGGAFSHIPGTAQIFSKAPTEGGGFSPKAYGRAVAHAATTGIKEAWKVFTSKEHQSDLSIRLKGEQYSRSRIELGGVLHAAMKEPAKQFAFEYAMAKQAENSIKAGISPETPGWREIAEARAFKYAEHSIFQERRIVSEAFNATADRLANSTNAQGDLSVTGQLGAAALKGTTPIVTVPGNIIAQTVEHIIGLPVGGTEAVNAWRKGIDNLKPEQADVIARHLKRGSLGAAMAALGIYMGAKAFGGLYRPGHKKEADDIDAEGVRINGQDVSRTWVHHPAWMVAQFYATWMKVAHEQISTKDSTEKGYLEGLAAAAAGLAEGFPLAQTAQTATQLLDDKQRDYATGKLERSAIPLGVQQAARAMDKDAEGNPVIRKPKGLVENLKSGIPGLRQQVPEK